MPDLPGFGFTYNPGPVRRQPGNSGQPVQPEQPMQLFAWQVCLAHLDRNMLEDASNYPAYAINYSLITQTLGLGLAQGQNAFALDGQLFAVALSIQRDDESIEIINESFPGYGDAMLVVSEQLLRGEDHGMIAQLPNGTLVPFIPPIASPS